ncbi:MAG: serine/threonine-protein kinase [Isosphaeraceae bacterium]|nr:serine/threonine-protein kinase [Isosphaeraceae bacterium]
MSQLEKGSPESKQDTLAWGDSGGQGAFRDLTGKMLGDFHVERMLGRGGMGEVYLARQISLNRQVALKVLRPDLLTKETYLKRFEAEATAVAKLNHPNIVHIYTLGSVDGVRFIAMEYVQGTNLRDYLAKKGALELPLAYSIMRQAGVAVGAAGEIGLVHRDIKPENLLLTRKGQVKIADFGLCRDLDAEHMQLTQPGVTMGTPLYMSPEQAQGQPTDHRSDLYSLGVTFYHMLAGQPPFKGDSPLSIALKQVKDVPVSLSVHRPEIPAELDRMVMRLIAKEPADRYQSAADMLRDLARVKEVIHAPTLAVPAADVGPPADAVNGSPTSQSRSQTTTTRTPSRTWTLPSVGLRLSPKLIAGLVLGGLFAGALVGWLTRPEDLLSAGAKEPDARPALWLVSGWRETVPRLNSPEEQYHYAQVAAPRGDEEAAWVAVLGYFPGARDWSSRAYTQLARWLLRHHDRDRLGALGHEIVRSQKSQTHEKELAEIIAAGVEALDGDHEGVIRDFNEKLLPHSLIDPALMELSLEVVLQASKTASRGGVPSSTLPKLREIQNKLVAELLQAETRPPTSKAAEGES